MGLDQYLTKKTYIGNKHREPKDKVKIIIPEESKDVLFPVGKMIKEDRINYIEEDVGYWRKANHIHQWFVDNVQHGEDDCRSYEVSEEQLQELLDLCIRVKNETVMMPGTIHTGTSYQNGIKTELTEEGMVVANDNVAQELLPCRGGFFFGNTDYNQHYMDDINLTINIIEELFREKNDKGYINGTIYYQSSW